MPVFTRTFIAAGHDHGNGSADVGSDKHLRTENFFISSEWRVIRATVGPEVKRGGGPFGLRPRFGQRRVLADELVQPLGAGFAVALRAGGCLRGGGGRGKAGMVRPRRRGNCLLAVDQCCAKEKAEKS